MTANQRRPGFRLPWSPDADDAAPEADAAAAEPGATPGDEASTAEAHATDETAAGAPSTDAGAADAPTTGGTAEAAVTEPSPEPPVVAEAEATEGAGAEAPSDAGATATPDPVAADATPDAAAAAGPPEGGDEFMRDLVAAMRGVADEARENGMADLRSRAEETVRALEADASRRQDDLRSRAEADVAGIGEWERAEAERIKSEAEQRRVARRGQLDQELAADATRTEGETRAVRDRVTAYERELATYHAQLADITDPAAFAAAAKRMPRPPSLTVEAGTAPAAAAAPTSEAPMPDAPPSETAVTGNGASPAGAHDDERASGEAALAARLEQLGATNPSDAATPPAPDEAGDAAVSPAATATPEPAAASVDPITTEVVVKGLGSFGAITGFRQSLSGVDGIDAVALSLGQTGEFVFRATHGAGFDVRAAIAALEGDGAKIEDRPEGGLRVTLERAR
jgi:nicotinate-nucleotide--dimethylbenzimidazole phosphoribosyltransferase